MCGAASVAAVPSAAAATSKVAARCVWWTEVRKALIWPACSSRSASMRSSASGRKDCAAARGAEGAAAAAAARGEIARAAGPAAQRLLTSSQLRAACHASHLARAVTASRDGWATLVAGAAVCLNHAYRRSRSALEIPSAGSSRAVLVALTKRCCSPWPSMPRGGVDESHARSPPCVAVAAARGEAARAAGPPSGALSGTAP
eukprot:scaffold71514_cov56-Phaeocystis_antarctica.AAC.1